MKAKNARFTSSFAIQAQLVPAYTERDLKIELRQGGALNLCQAQPAPKQLNLKSLAMRAGHKFSGCPTQTETIFQSRAVDSYFYFYYGA